MNKLYTISTGGFRREDFRFVYNEIILKYNIKSVLEFGCGLSTELLTLVVKDVLSLETREQFYEIYKKAQYNIKLCDYTNYPELNRKYDLGFVDGPGAAEINERKNSVLHAQKYCDIIYLHDYGLKQFECFDDTWIQLTKPGEHKSHLFIR